MLYLPVILYRLSLKTTAIAYFPLLLTVQQSTLSVPFLLQLEQVRDGKLPGFRRKMAWLFGGIIVLKVLLYSLKIKVVEDWNATSLRRFVALVVLPEALPAWQWATLVNAVL